MKVYKYQCPVCHKDSSTMTIAEKPSKVLTQILVRHVGPGNIDTEILRCSCGGLWPWVSLDKVLIEDTNDEKSKAQYNEY